MINIDGFIVTHVIEAVEYWDEEQVKKYLPDFKPVNVLHPDKPITMGAFGMPGIFSEAKKSQNEALLASKPHIMKAWDEMAQIVGRTYEPVETYKLEGAETAFLTMGSFSETASIAIDKLREQGKPVGQIKLRLWRPFPFDEIREAVKGIKNAHRHRPRDLVRRPRRPRGERDPRGALRRKEHAGDRELPLRLRGTRRDAG